MKNILLTISLMTLAYASVAQIVVQGVSPIQTNFNFAWADPQSGWATPDWNVAGNYVQDTLMLVDDGTPGLNAQGNPISAEGCNPLINNLSGKIAVVYRNTCDFSTKALNAQNAGAVGVIIINRFPNEVFAPGAGSNGANVTIPVVMVDLNDGQNLVSTMQNGPVVVFMGNTQNAFTNNISINEANALISRYGSIPYNMANNGYSFRVGLWALNSGSSDNNFNFNATITNPNGVIVYSEDLNNVLIPTGAEYGFVNGQFPDFVMTNPIPGKYTLTYSASIVGATDQITGDNVLTSNFFVTNDILSLARQNETTGEIVANSFPNSSPSYYQACMKLEDLYPNNQNKLGGLNFWISAYNASIQDEQIITEIYEWNDADPLSITYNDLNLIRSTNYFYSYNASATLVNLPLIPYVSLNDNQRYLVCLSTYNPDIAFGYDNGINYTGNYANYSQPIAPINTDGNWYNNAWDGGRNAISLGLKLIECNLTPVNQTIYPAVCDSYTSLSGQVYDQSGIYYDTVYSDQGCDSLYQIINLTIQNSSSSFSAIICDGESYNWNGNNYYSWGQYSQTFTNQYGCDSIVTLDLSVYYNDNIYINPNPAFGNAPLNVAFANQTSNLINYNFTWYFGDGSTLQSNAPFLSHIYTQGGPADVTVVAQHINTGCISSQTFDNLINVIGGVTCTHVATINQTQPLSVCAGDTVTLSCNTDPSYSYQWNRNGVPVSGATTSSYNPTQSGSYTVTIYQNNCPVTSNGISVSINPLPNVPVISSTGEIVPCLGGTMTLSVPSGTGSYSWNNGSTSNMIVVSQSGNYFVTVTDLNGCQRTSNTFAVNASNLPEPQLCIIGMDSLTNENRIVWEKPLSSGIDSFYVYKESNLSNVYTKIGATNYNDLAVFLDLNSNPSVQAYRYKISALDTCGVETNVGDFHKTIHLTINQGVGNSWNLIWSHYEGLTFPSYNIYRGTDPSNITLLTTIQSNLNSYTDLAPPAGGVYYQIEVVNPINCDPTKSINYGVSRSNIVNNGQVAVQDLGISSVNLYPNPTNDKLTISVSNELVGNDYVISDFSGRILLNGKITASTEEVDLDSFANGTYFVQIQGLNFKVLKIVKQ